MVAPQPFFRARGTPFSVLHRIRALCQSGYKVDLVTYPFGEDVPIPGLNIIRSSRPRLVRDVKIGPSVAKLMLDVPLFFETRRLLKVNSYTAIHSHEEAAFFCVGLARKHGLPHIYDMHSSLPHQLDNFDAYNLKFIRSAFDRLEKNVLTTCDGVITICPELAEIAGSICGSTPHSMIENTADDREVFGASEEDLEKLYKIGNGPVILYTGTFEPYQGLDLLVEAMAELVADYPDIQLMMVGGQLDQINKYKRVVADARLSGNVIFTGTVHPSKIPGFVDMASIIVSPRSSGTNTPLKIYGYMRSGRPVVATDMLTHTQVLSNETAILVPPTALGLADGIRKCLADPKWARQVALNAKTMAEDLFSDELYICKVNQLYDRALAPNRENQTRADAA